MKKQIITFCFLLFGTLLLTSCEKKEGIEQVFCYECTTASSLFYDKTTYCNITPEEAFQMEYNGTGYFNGDYVRTTCVQQP